MFTRGKMPEEQCQKNEAGLAFLWVAISQIFPKFKANIEKTFDIKVKICLEKRL